MSSKGKGDEVLTCPICVCHLDLLGQWWDAEHVEHVDPPQYQAAPKDAVQVTQLQLTTLRDMERVENGCQLSVLSPSSEKARMSEYYAYARS